eukprot:6206145-Pleurochrysis_carterae.AAC.3
MQSVESVERAAYVFVSTFGARWPKIDALLNAYLEGAQLYAAHIGYAGRAYHQHTESRCSPWTLRLLAVAPVCHLILLGECKGCDLVAIISGFLHHIVHVQAGSAVKSNILIATKQASKRSEKRQW